MIIEKKGNIFTTQCDVIVNAVNCVGVMGAGIAYEFRLRYPDMFKKYKILCINRELDIGKLWIFSSEDKKILNFPTKYDWKYPSKEEYLHKGLQKFVETYRQRGITSIAFPLLGSQKGGLTSERSLEIMKQHLKKCDIDIEIWHFDPMAKDDLYNQFKSIMHELDDQTIKTELNIRIDIVRKIRSALEKPYINSISGLLRVNGVGGATLEKLFQYIIMYKKNHTNLFNCNSTTV